MQRGITKDISLFLGLLAAGVVVRLIFRDLPNFAPVAAITLFAAYVFRSALLAVCLPVSIMALSDLVVGGYEGRMMALVYASLAAPVMLRGPLRRWLRFDARGLQSCLPATGLITCSLASSLLFFGVTNCGSWMWSGMYQPTWSGLVECYAAALPFFRNTLLGDLFFAVTLFGSYAWVASLWGHTVVGEFDHAASTSPSC